MHLPWLSRFAIAAGFVSLAFAVDAPAEGLPAFPGAEGAGSTTPAGRGGDVYVVNTLADSGPGSLREACEADGPRIAIINVCGMIALDSPIVIRNPFLTIAGQRASGTGACVTNHGLRIAANDIVIRYLRIRPGAGSGIDITRAQRVVIDHCTIGWTAGVALAISGESRDITVQWSLIAESLVNDTPARVMEIDINEGVVSLHHNYLAHHSSGFPHIAATSNEPGPTIDFRNNVIYDWVSASGEMGAGHGRINLIANTYKAGPSTEEFVRGQAIKLHSTQNRLHIVDNDLAGSAMARARNGFMAHMPQNFSTRHHGDMLKTDGSFGAPTVETSDPGVALRSVLSQAGATRPKRDEVDERVIAQYRLSAGRIIEDPAQTGGWPEYPANTPLPDTDRDGMPDEWEVAAGLDPRDETDARGDRDGDGYANIEEWLNTDAK